MKDPQVASDPRPAAQTAEYRAKSGSCAAQAAGEPGALGGGAAAAIWRSDLAQRSAAAIWRSDLVQRSGAAICHSDLLQRSGAASYRGPRGAAGPAIGQERGVVAARRDSSRGSPPMRSMAPRA